MGYKVNEIPKTEFNLNVSFGRDEIQQKLLDNPLYLESDLIINCIGIVKQYSEKYSEKEMKFINGTFPHYLAEIANLDKKSFCI